MLLEFCFLSSGFFAPQRSLGWKGMFAPRRCSARAKPVFLTPHWPQARAATCKHQLAPESQREGIRYPFRIRRQRAGAVPPAVLVFRAVFAMVHKGSWKVLRDLGQGEDAAPLNRVWSSQLCLNLQRWENLAGMSCPFSPSHGVGWRLFLLTPTQGEGRGWTEVHCMALAPALVRLWLSARDWGCQEGPPPPQNLLHCWETPTFPFSCICARWGSPLTPQILPCWRASTVHVSILPLFSIAQHSHIAPGTRTPLKATVLSSSPCFMGGMRQLSHVSPAISKTLVNQSCMGG